MQFRAVLCLTIFTTHVRRNQMRRKPFLNASEVAKRTGYKRRSFYNAVKDGRFPIKPVEGMKPLKWHAHEIEAFVRGDKA